MGHPVFAEQREAGLLSPACALPLYVKWRSLRRVPHGAHGYSDVDHISAVVYSIILVALAI